MKCAAYCMTRNIYHKIVPSLRSLLMHSSVDTVYLLTEDDDIGFPVPQNVEILNVSGQQYFHPTSANYRCRWTYMVLMRVALCHVLPECDKVLSLDLDTIIDKNIDDIWDIDLGNYYLAAVPEPHKSNSNQKYYNGGVVLWNLTKMRDGKADDLIDCLNRYEYTFTEQDCINERCHDQILTLDGMWNTSRWTWPPEHPTRIYHFAGTPDWFEREPLVQNYKGDLLS